MEKWTEDFQNFYIESVANQMLERPYVSGEILWHFMDFRVDLWNAGEGLYMITRSFATRPGEYNNKGIVDRNRHPKSSYFKLREIYAKWKKLYPAKPKRRATS
jgi:hypothetical protein